MDGRSVASIKSPLPPSRGAPVTLSYKIEDYVAPSSQSSHDLRKSFSWGGMISDPSFVAAPVSAFKHGPMSDCWDNIIVGMKVEVENREADGFGTVFSDAYWVASVLRISGYKGLLRFEGFGQDDSKDFWINLCSPKVHPVGWCVTKGRPLIPPKTIQNKYTDWKEFLVKRLTGARTMPTNFYSKVWESVGSIFKIGMKLEVVDKNRICQVRVATILEITGKRLYVQCDDVDNDDRGFWCHEESPLIHPVGWARRVDHQIVASKEYINRCDSENYLPTDCTSDMFPEYRSPSGESFVTGMKLEAVDPLNLATICVATVMKVLRFGYIMIRIDGYDTDDTGYDWFCYHTASPLIFPPGFCERNNLALKPPSGFEVDFSWYEYLKATQSQAANIKLFCQHGDVKHGFKVGMKVEASDQMDPRLICVSTIAMVVGRLLRVHFDGWEDDYDQWMDCESVDIYPVGWSELVGHKLEGPRQNLPPKKEKKKPVGRKTKKRSATHASNGHAQTYQQTQKSESPNGSSSAKKSKKSSTPIPEIETPKTAYKTVQKIAPTTAPRASPSSTPRATPSSVQKTPPPSTPKIIPSAPRATPPNAPRATFSPAPKATFSPAPKATISSAPKTTISSAPKAAISSAPKATISPAPRATFTTAPRPTFAPAPPRPTPTVATPQLPPIPPLKISASISPKDLGEKKSPKVHIEYEIKSPKSHHEHEKKSPKIQTENGSSIAEHPPQQTQPLPASQEMKVIPRLVDSAGQAAVQRGKDSTLDPSTWTVDDMSHFLTINECGSVVEFFINQNVDGKQFLSFDNAEMLKLVNNKFGPCLKIQNLQDLLKARMNPAHARFLATQRK